MDNSQVIIQYILKYGTAVIFLLLFLEQLNFPGLVSSIIMPAIGGLVAKYEYSFIYVFILTLVAAILGSLTLYYLGYFIGNPMINWIKKKFPKTKEPIDKILVYTNKYGNKGVLLCRFIPGVRTLGSLVCGSVKESLIEFLIFSSIGIGIWNLVLMLSGYLTINLING